MASQSDDSTRPEHRRSPSDEDNNDTGNPSKRRKHHHHHHRHRHHSRSGKKEDRVENAAEPDVEIGEKSNDDSDEVGVGPAGAATAEASPGSILGIEYDMEEGEIVEDDKELDVSQKRKNPDSSFPSEGTTAQEVENSGELGESRMDVKNDKNLVRKKHNDLGMERTSGVESVAIGYVHEYLRDDLPHKEYSKQNEDYSGENIPRDGRNAVLAEDGRKRYKGLSNSPSLGTHHDRARSQSRPRSPVQSRGRSQSQCGYGEGLLVDNPKEYDSYHSKRRYRSHSDDDRVIDTGRDYRHASKVSLRDREREQSAYSRHISQVDRHRSREIRYREREGRRDVDRDRRKDKDGDREGARERERERARERDRAREREPRGRRERDTESSRDRNRDRDGEKYFRQSKYIDDGEPDRYDDYGPRKHTEISNKGMLGETDHGNNDGSEVNLSERKIENSRRYENESEDYQEKVALQLAEQEQDYLEKIREESRRRTKAILEKYKNQKLHQQPQLEHEEKKQVEQPSLPIDTASADGQNDGVDDDVADPPFPVEKSPPLNGIFAFEKPSVAAGLGAGIPKSEGSDDKVRDDIFGDSPAGVCKTGKGDGVAIESSGLHDNWDDPEGYYCYRFGELLDGRYEIIAAHGKGVFSTVVRAKDLKAKSGDPEEVAIKIIRNNETMYKAGMEELVILKKLVRADPENRRHCVCFLSSFKYRNHLCLVFESLHMNLHEVLKRFGRNIGLKLTAVRVYAKQLFIALKHLKNCGVLHCDIKPDNMLVNEAKNVLKLCDFGNAMFAGKNEVTPYLVSRFYRAPEIILGLPYDHPMDMWSVGCCLFELYAGKVLFPGPTNNDMLRLQMELKGSFPKKMIRKGAFKDQHFDQSLNFLATEEDPVTKKAIRREILNVKPKDFGTLILGSPGEVPKMLANFKDLLEKISMLDPDKRMTVSQALSHPFITGK